MPPSSSGFLSLSISSFLEFLFLDPEANSVAACWDPGPAHGFDGRVRSALAAASPSP
jgi:hypothetical protein